MTLLVVLMLALFGTFIVLPIYLVNGLGLEPIAIGTLMLPGGLLMGLLGPFVGRLYDRFGPRLLVVPGAAVTSLALWGMASFGTDTSFWFVFATYTVLCLGLGFLFTPAVHLGDRRPSAAPVLARQRDHRDRAAGGGSRRNGDLRRVPGDRHGSGGVHRSGDRDGRSGRRRRAPRVPGRARSSRSPESWRRSSCASPITPR